MKKKRIPRPRLEQAKLAYLVISLPIWDIGRTEVQRVMDFILYEILKEPKHRRILEEWLAFWKLPYLVQPAVKSDDLTQFKEAQHLALQQQQQPPVEVSVPQQQSERTSVTDAL